MNEILSIDIEKFKLNLELQTSQKLSEIVVCYRYLGCFPELSILCMEELSKRRLNGDPFLFENYIDQCLKELPVLNFNLPNLREILHQNIKK